MVLRKINGSRGNGSRLTDSRWMGSRWRLPRCVAQKEAIIVVNGCDREEAAPAFVVPVRVKSGFEIEFGERFLQSFVWLPK